VRREVVEHHDVAGLERRREELLDIGAEGDPGHRTVEDQRGNDPRLPEAGDQRRRAPVAVRHGGDQAFGRGTPAVAPRHVGGGAGLVEEHEPLGVHVALPDLPAPAPACDIGPVLLGRSQRLFLCLRPIRWSAQWMVESAVTTPKAALQLGLDLRQRDVRCRLDQPTQVGSMRLEDRTAIAAVAFGGGTPRRAHPLHQLDRCRRAHGKAASGCADRAAPLDRLDNPPPQVQGHRCRHGDISAVSTDILESQLLIQRNQKML
jgi:hypothetical protein